MGRKLIGRLKQMNLKNAIFEVNDARIEYHKGDIVYDEAESRCADAMVIINNRVRKIAKKFDVPYERISFSEYFLKALL